MLCLGRFQHQFLNHENYKQTTDFVDILYSNSSIPVINRLTRVNGFNDNFTAPIIDNIVTNDIVKLHSSFQGVMLTQIKDHLPVIHCNFNYHDPMDEKFIIRRNRSSKKRMAFKDACLEVDWTHIFSTFDTQTAFALFHNKIINLFNVHLPKRKVRSKYATRKPWLTEGLRKAIKTKNKLYVKAYLNLLRKEEKNYYAELLIANKSNMKKTWSVMKSIVNKNKSNQYQSKFKLNDGSVTTNKLETSIHMMTSSNGNIFRVTGHLCGKFTGPRWISRTKASDAGLWCFLWFTPE